MFFKPLPLLRLLCLVHLEILRNLNFTELYRLAKLSEGAKTVVKKITRTRQCSLMLTFDDVPYFYLERIGVKEETEEFKWKKGYALDEFTGTPITQADVMRQIGNTIILFADLFNKPTVQMRIAKESLYTPAIVRAFRIVNYLGMTLNHIAFELDDSSKEVYFRLIHLFKNVHSLTLNSDPPSGFPIKWYPSFECDFLHIRATSWFKIERLMNHFMDCKKVHFHFGPLSFPLQKVRPLLQKWIRGENRMETLIISPSFGAIPFQTLLAGIPAVLVHGVRPKSPNKQFRDGCIITMHNGKKAFVGSHLDCFVMTTDFQELASITDIQTASRSIHMSNTSQ